MIHRVSYHDKSDDLVDVDYTCSHSCMGDLIETIFGGQIPDGFVPNVAGSLKTPNGRISYGGWPGGSETDYDVHCAHCERLLWKGLAP